MIRSFFIILLLAAFLTPLAWAEPPALSESSTIILSTGHIGPLQQSMQELQNRYDQLYPRIQPMQFLPVDDSCPYTHSLLQEYSQASHDLKEHTATIEEIYQYIDTYPGQDWDKRFGQTGLFHHILQLHQQSILLQSQDLLCQICINHQQRQEESPECMSLISSLQNFLSAPHTLRVPYETAACRLIQLTRLQSQASGLSETSIQSLTALLKDTLNRAIPISMQWQVRLEALWLTGLTSRGSETFSRQAGQLTQWLRQKKSNLANYPQHLLTVTLMEYHLLPSPQPDRLFLKLEHLQDSSASLAPFIRLQIADLLGRDFQQSQSTKNLDAFVKSHSNFSLLCLAEHYQYDKPDSQQLAIHLYETLLKNRSDQCDLYPKVLYRLGLCYQQTDSPVKTIETWSVLAQTFPRWSSPAQPGTNTTDALNQAAILSYDLFCGDPNQYAPLAEQTLSLLTGQIAPDKNIPQGPFADSPYGQSCRYYLGRVLQHQNHFSDAAEFYATVPQNDSNHRAAGYYEILCLWQNHLAQNGKQSPFPQVLLKSITNFLQQDPADTFAQNAANILLSHCRDTRDLKTPIPVLSILLAADADNAQWHGTALTLLHHANETLNNLHAHRDARGVLELTTSILPLAKQTYDRHKNLTLQSYLQIILLHHLYDKETDHSELVPLMRTAEKTEGQSQQLWLIRAQAIYALIQGDYPTSRQHWYQIRKATQNHASEDTEYFHWEARYFGLYCLLKQGDTRQTAHAIDVLLATNPQTKTKSLWLNQIRLLKDQIPGSH